MTESLELHCDPDHLRDLREQARLSQSEVAVRLGFKQGSEYQDVEFHSEELATTLSLTQVKILARLYGEDYLTWWGLPRLALVGSKHQLIREARIAKGWTLQELEDASGWAVELLERIEVDDKILENECAAFTLVDIAQALDIPLACLLS